LFSKESELLSLLMSVKPGPFKVNAGSAIPYYLPLSQPSPPPSVRSTSLIASMFSKVNIDEIPILRPPVPPPRLGPPKWEQWQAEAIDLATSIEESQTQNSTPHILQELLNIVDDYFGVVHQLKVLLINISW
jgi:hypothetical protein